MVAERKTKSENAAAFKGLGAIEARPIEREMQTSYLDYAMSVIVARALPDVRDGLKPVHRRILYSMHEMGLRPTAKYQKSAKIVGHAMGNYHPHGDTAIYDTLVRMAQDFAMRQPLVQGQGNFGCFTKETKVKLTDGRDCSFEDLVKEYKAGKRNYTYTVNTLGLISIAEILHPRKTKKKAELVRVTLDNGTSVCCTPDHLFMMRSGPYKQASALTHGESLMPLYQKVSTAQDRLQRAGYILVFQNKKDAWVPAHHLADNDNLTHGVYQKSAGRVRHHIDFNKLNNNPENIRRVGWKEHFDIHVAHASHQHRDAAYREKIAQGREILKKKQVINQDIYEQERAIVYPYGMATTWDTGLQRYYQSDANLLLHELNKNHKVVSVEWLPEREDVYDLTIDGSHNFALACGVFVHNSMDGDSAAAMRYTEARLAGIAEELLRDIDKETVPFGPNYDGSHQEPRVLPATLPNLLLNGSVGIAVGMATDIPPHNLGELCDGIMQLIEHPDCDIDSLTPLIKGPDFPTGGIIYGKNDIAAAYATGKGPIVMRAKTDIVERGDAYDIIVHEVPYQVNKATLLETIADLVKEKKIEGIRDLRDESNKDGVRVVIELKKDAYPKKVLNQLFKYTQLQGTFHVNMLALVDGIQPRVLTLKMILEEYVKHRRDVITRRTQFDLNRAKERAHILEGLVMALEDIDAIIATIKKSKDRDDAKVNLVKRFRLSDRQAIAILEMRLQQLANLERLKIEEELKEKKKLIKELEEILKSPKRILGVIMTEVRALKEKYATPRRTDIVVHPVGEFSDEDLIPNEAAIVLLTRDGYLKRLPPETFRTQTRGGKGVIGLTTKEEDTVDQLLATTTHTNLLFFTTRGRVFQLRAHEVPEAGRAAKGQAIVNFLQLAPGERVTEMLSVADLKQVNHVRSRRAESVTTATVGSSASNGVKFLVMVTIQGVIKKVAVDAFSTVRRSGLIALKLKEGDELAWVKSSRGNDEVVIVTQRGQAIRFKETDVRPMGRTAAGVRGIRLKGSDVVVGMDVVSAKESKSAQLLSIMENGFGKRTTLAQYKVQRRGGSGIKTANVTAKTGALMSTFVIDLEALPEGVHGDLLVVSAKGQVIRLAAKTISVVGRATQGVRVMRFKEGGDRVASVTLV